MIPGGTDMYITGSGGVKHILDTGLTPSIWGLSIIKPIPKKSMIDPHLPLEYRGFSLLSSTYTFYTSILNSRLTDTAERNNIFHYEQNNFLEKSFMC